MGISQEEIVQSATTVMKGLEALRVEHQSMLGELKESLVRLVPKVLTYFLLIFIIQSPKVDDVPHLLSHQEKTSMLERSLDMIDLGLGEAHVMAALAGHLQVREEGFFLTLDYQKYIKILRLLKLKSRSLDPK